MRARGETVWVRERARSRRVHRTRRRPTGTEKTRFFRTTGGIFRLCRLLSDDYRRAAGTKKGPQAGACEPVGVAVG
jgi:hypothetical protein